MPMQRVTRQDHWLDQRVKPAKPFGHNRGTGGSRLTAANSAPKTETDFEYLYRVLPRSEWPRLDAELARARKLAAEHTAYLERRAKRAIKAVATEEWRPMVLDVRSHDTSNAVEVPEVSAVDTVNVTGISARLAVADFTNGAFMAETASYQTPRCEPVPQAPFIVTGSAATLLVNEHSV